MCSLLRHDCSKTQNVPKEVADVLFEAFVEWSVSTQLFLEVSARTGPKRQSHISWMQDKFLYRLPIWQKHFNSVWVSIDYQQNSYFEPREWYLRPIQSQWQLHTPWTSKTVTIILTFCPHRAFIISYDSQNRKTVIFVVVKKCSLFGTGWVFKQYSDEHRNWNDMTFCKLN